MSSPDYNYSIFKQNLGTFARNFSIIDFFSENFTIETWWVSDAKNVNKLGGHRIRFGENMPSKTPKSE